MIALVASARFADLGQEVGQVVVHQRDSCIDRLHEIGGGGDIRDLPGVALE
jgi:hypothetical protein